MAERVPEHRGSAVIAVLWTAVEDRAALDGSLGDRVDVVGEPRDEYYGYREYDARDFEGGLWSFMSRLEGDDDG